MKKIKFLLICLLCISLLMMGCTSGDLPPEPPAPGKQGGESNLAGHAFTETLGEFNFADPGDTFKISLDAIGYEDEELQIDVNADFLYGKGYIAADNGEWEEFSYEGQKVKNWRKPGPITSIKISKQDFPLGKYYIVAYACDKVEDEWGCHDWKWMAHEFEVICYTNGDCDEGFECFDGQCQYKAPCTNNNMCDEGFECYSGECVEKGPCESDDDCEGNTFCDSGECVALPDAPGALDEPLPDPDAPGNENMEVFAVGSGGKYYHYSDKVWSEEQSITSNDLWGIWGTSPNNLYFVGDDGVIHYDGESEWTPMIIGSNDNPLTDFRGVWGFSENNIYAVGYEGKITHYSGLLNDDGTKIWEQESSGTGVFLKSIWGSSEDDIYAVGYEGIIIHYNGNSWEEMESGTSYDLSSIWGSSGDDIYAVGSGGTLIHYDGNSWSSMESGTTDHLKVVFGTGPDNIYIGGGNTLLHFDGDVLENINLEISDLESLWIDSEDNPYIIGYNDQGYSSIFTCNKEDGCSLFSLSDYGQINSLIGFNS
ncbi:hypothetical protein HOC35_06505 [Candidatus Woesearchaeota archaeon]|jgi:hypothetical protein|nr:hypothetical protein [Candidatus Woesearchaeota archaeon]